ncbi:MAG: T9SS type A sorting domain-containing protein [Candidatus Kapaibacterium sp.]
MFNREPRHIIRPLVFGVIVLMVGLITLQTTSRQTEPESTYVGVQTCLQSGCHAEKKNDIYQGGEAFRETMHAKTHRRPNRETCLIDTLFRNHTLLSYHDPRVKGGGDDLLTAELRLSGDIYQVRLSVRGIDPDSTDWMEVLYVMGGSGWLQRYIVQLDGSWYVLPFQYLLPTYRNVEGEGSLRFFEVEKWVAYDTEANRLSLLRSEDSSFVNSSWDAQCSGCHVNPFSLDRVEGSKIFPDWQATWTGSEVGDSATRDMNLSIGCESCHGPGSAHVADPQNREVHYAISPKYWDQTEKSVWWTDRKLDICNQCHNRHKSSSGLHDFAYDDEGETTYRPQLDLRDFVRDVVGDGSYWPDGVSAKKHHQTGQDYVRSRHYTEHIFPNGCYNCHDVHANTNQPYMLNRDWYSLKRTDGCGVTGCHSSFLSTQIRKGETYNLHTGHLQQHSQCVNCHYTKVATFGKNGDYEFSDHSDLVIRPLATINRRYDGSNGMPNSCALSCHRNGYGDRNRPNPFFDVIDGEAMRAPDFGILDTNLMDWSEPTDIALADSLWEGFKRLYPQFVSSVRESVSANGRSGFSSLYPNPASTEVEFRYAVNRQQQVRITIFTILGNPLLQIVDARLERGEYVDQWFCRDEAGVGVPDGLYIIRIEGEDFSDLRRIVVLQP